MLGRLTALIIRRRIPRVQITHGSDEVTSKASSTANALSEAGLAICARLSNCAESSEIELASRSRSVGTISRPAALDSVSALNTATSGINPAQRANHSHHAKISSSQRYRIPAVTDRPGGSAPRRPRRLGGSTPPHPSVRTLIGAGRGSLRADRPSALNRAGEGGAPLFTWLSEVAAARRRESVPSSRGPCCS